MRVLVSLSLFVFFFQLTVILSKCECVYVWDAVSLFWQSGEKKDYEIKKSYLLFFYFIIFFVLFRLLACLSVCRSKIEQRMEFNAIKEEQQEDLSLYSFL